MKITIRKPLGYTQIGRKDNQEDAVWPSFEDVSPGHHCIVLCDGVGGSEHGEVASQTASRVIGELLTNALVKKDVLEEEDIVAAVDKAYDALDAIDTRDGRVSMATTLACVAIHSGGVLAAHMGDSRIYHIRPNVGILYQSTDHSLVNALLQAGELAPEDVESFPRKNVITKALQPNCKRLKAEVHSLTDIEAGDYLFLCSDGVLEQLTNNMLKEIFSTDFPDCEKLRLLESVSIDRTRDNYTAYVIPIDKVEEQYVVKCNEELVVDMETIPNEDTVLEETAMFNRNHINNCIYRIKKFINKIRHR